MHRWLVTVGLAACSFTPQSARDDAWRASDGASDTSVDTVIDAPIDAAIDAPIDAPTDAPGAPITLVQVCSNVSLSPAASIDCTFSGAQIAGNTNIVIVDWGGTTETLTNLVDTAGNTYVATGIAGSGSYSEVLYYAANIRSFAANSNRLTATISGSVGFPKLRAIEYAALRPTNPFESGLAASGNGTALMVGPVTTITPHALLIAASRPSNTTTANAPFVARDTSDGDLVEDREVAATGAYTANATQSVTGSWVMVMGVFRGQ